MVRPLKGKGTFVALAAIVVAVGGLAWHLLACVDTQMAFSPDGSELAFTVIDETADGTGWRLFVLKGDDRLELIDSYWGGILSGLVYLLSPAGMGNWAYAFLKTFFTGVSGALASALTVLSLASDENRR